MRQIQAWTALRAICSTFLLRRVFRFLTRQFSEVKFKFPFTAGQARADVSS